MTTVPSSSSHQSEESHKIVSEPYRYLDAIKGKGMRALMMDAFNLWLQIPEETLGVVKNVVNQLHVASLLVDDIEDDSKMRRGQPSAHEVYGVPATINSSNYMIFVALESVRKLGNTDAIESFMRELISLHQGQGLDIYWRDRNQCPTEEEYREMVQNKTSGLFRLAVGLMQAFSEDKSDYYKLADLFGLWYQIRDDYISLTDIQHMKNKCFCEDIGEGKFSFCIIHSIRSRPDDHRLLNILKLRPNDVDVKKHALKYMESTGSFEYTREILSGLQLDIVKEVQKLGGNTIFEKLFERLSVPLPKCIPSL